MKKIFTLLFVAISFFSSAQKRTIIFPDGNDNDIQMVKPDAQGDKVYGGRFFETSNGSPTLLNMGAVYPASPITIMIPGDVRAKMGYAPELQLKDKNVCVLGKVILFKEKPEIIVYNISQIQVQ